MECVTEMNEKQGGYHCIAIHLKEESSIVLGATNLEVQYRMYDILFVCSCIYIVMC